MKKLLLLLIAVLFIVKVNAQQLYFHFPDSNAVWTGWNGIKTIIDTTTTINNKVYKRYTNTPVSAYVGSPGGASSGLLREDTLTKRIYILSMQDTTKEDLLYDFSLQVNQTTTVYSAGSASIAVKVEAIDSILVGSTYHKRLRVVDPYSLITWAHYEYWIEGIGSTSSVLYSGEGVLFMADICPPTLICFEQNAVQLYHHPNYTNTCFVNYNSACIGGIGNNYLNKINLSVYPNPASNAIIVGLPQSNVYNIKLTNVLGGLCKEILSANQTTEMDISQIKAGIYFLQVFEKGNLIAVQKIVKE